MNKNFKIEEIRTLKKGDVKKIRERLEKEDIDLKILDLVIGLRAWGVNTTSSCQGGGKEHGKKFPWVSIQWKDLGKAARLLLEWNYRTGKSLNDPKTVIWVIEPSWESRIRSLPGPSLKIFQEDAVKFGQFLQKLPKDFD